MLWLFGFLYRQISRQEMGKIILGRIREKGRPESGRFLESDIRAIHQRMWRYVELILPQAGLDQVPTLGNRHNVFLAVVTIAGYQALLSHGIEREYALELLEDVGWRLYSKFISLPRAVARLLTNEPQRQVDFMLRSFLVFPFSAPGRPGYEVQAWAEPNRFCTDWTYCPPLEFVRSYAERAKREDLVEVFQRTWCSYDWAFTYAMVDRKDGASGHYERPHTLSLGDEICDMRWYAVAPYGSRDVAEARAVFGD